MSREAEYGANVPGMGANYRETRPAGYYEGITGGASGKPPEHLAVEEVVRAVAIILRQIPCLIPVILKWTITSM
jgi:hypothetical protein